MGAEHKDSDPGSVRGKKGTDPGMGHASQPHVLAEPPLVTAPHDMSMGTNDTSPDDGRGDEDALDGETTEVPIADDTADVVDFDALNAALGVLPPAHAPPVVTDSEGRSSATYSSARPHSIPATRAPLGDPNAPAVIVADDALLHTPTQPAVRQMTVPMNGGPPPSSPHLMAGRPPSPSHPFLPTATEPYIGNAVAAMPSDHLHQTPRMSDHAQRPRQMTIVVHERGPSRLQKVAVFVTMLVVFVAGGIAFLIYKPASGMSLNLRGGGNAPPPPASLATFPPAVTAPLPTASGVVAPAPSPTVLPVIPPASAPSAVAAPTVSVIKKPRPLPPRVEKKDPSLQ